MRDEHGNKLLTAGRLIELLKTLPEESRVMPNSVGNLLVVSGDGERSIACVDFNCAGEIETFDDEEN